MRFLAGVQYFYVIDAICIYSWKLNTTAYSKIEYLSASVLSNRIRDSKTSRQARYSQISFQMAWCVQLLMLATAFLRVSSSGLSIPLSHYQLAFVVLLLDFSDHLWPVISLRSALNDPPKSASLCCGHPSPSLTPQFHSNLRRRAAIPLVR